LSDEKSNLPAQLPTDDFLRQVKEKEEEAARKSQEARENPMSEEGLRLQQHEGDADKMKLDHSYFAFKGHSRCRLCGISLADITGKLPPLHIRAHDLITAFDEQVPNGHPEKFEYAGKGWDGAGKTSAVLREGYKLLLQGYPDPVIEARFLSMGFTNKASEYVAALHKIQFGTNIYNKIKDTKDKVIPSHADEKKGGMTKT